MTLISGDIQAEETPLPAQRSFVAQRDHWPTAQYFALFGGVLLVATLLLKPSVGLLVMWNMLIPVAPALIVVAPGLWRNICPMATFSLLPRKFGISGKRIPARRLAAVLSVAGLAALLLIVPLRHLSLNTNGPMTALMLVLSAGVAFLMGMRFEWRSGWCNSLCPIHPAEKLYGLAPAITLPNARCGTCRKCTAPCPDSTHGMNASITGPSRFEKTAGHIMIGGFAGFIWGWYRLPDILGGIGLYDIATAYFWPCVGGLTTLSMYAIARRWVCRTKSDRDRLVRCFAAAAVCTYYWYRIPELVGFGVHPETGLLYDLSGAMPDITPLSHLLTTSFFVWFMVIRRPRPSSWLKRPRLES